MNKRNRVYIIAEIGPNHNGSLKLAEKMVRLLKNSGADAVKFQLGAPEEVYSQDAFMAEYQKKNTNFKSIQEMSKKNQLSHESHLKLKKLCKMCNLDYMCSAFDLKSLEFLIKKIKISTIKIPSGEITSLDILKYISKLKKRVILSTGMATFQDIKNAITEINKHFKKKITLLHCISNYPAAPEKLNLNVIKSLKETFKTEIGYSDHSLGGEACVAAVALGAKVIEKHVTLSRQKIGPDHKASMEIKDFCNLVKQIRSVEKMLGNKKKKISNEEIRIMKVARKSIIVNKSLKKGDIIKKEYLSFKRPGTGISPMKINLVVGRKVKKNTLKNKLLKI